MPTPGPSRTKPPERSTSATGRRAGLPSVLGHGRIWPEADQADSIIEFCCLEESGLAGSSRSKRLMTHTRQPFGMLSTFA